MKFLLVKKRGKWRLLKGAIEKVESRKKALNRELREEVGLERKFKGKIHSYKAEGIRHEVSTFKVKVRKLEPKISKELQDARWFSKGEALKKLYWSEREALKKAK